MYTARELEVMLHIAKAAEIIRAETSGVYQDGLLHGGYVTTLDERKRRWADNADRWCAALDGVLDEVGQVA